MKKKPASQSAFFNPRVLIAMLFVAALSGGLFAFRAFSGASANAPGQNQVQKSGLHKVSVSDPQVAETLKSRGARLIADYGSFSMFNVSDSQVNNLPESRSIQKADENNLVFLNAATIDTQTVEAQAMRMLGEWKPGKQMRLIQFAGPVRPEWYQALVATGVQVVTYIPQNTYLVYGNQGNLQAAQSLAADPTIAQWDAEYTATWRIHPTISGANVKGAEPINNRSAAGNEQFTIQMVDDPSENAVTKALIDQRKVEPVISEERIIGYYNVNVALPKDAINQIAERGDVVSIQPWVTPTLNCERQDMIMAGNLTGNLPTPGDYIAYLTSHGFNLGTAANFGVNVSDTGLDNGTTTPFQFLLYTNGDATNPAGSRVLYVTAQGTASPGDLPGCNGHGNLNTSIIGGYVPTGTVGGVNFGAFPHADASGFRWGLGIAPFVKVGLSVIFTTTGSFTNPNIPALESAAYQSGTRISSNSWGAAVGGAYNATAQTYDALVRDAQTGTAGNQEDIIVFSAGNSGSGGQTIGSPGTAKNVITVGAAEGVNAFGGADGCGTTDAQADSANDIVPFSSRGPTTDQRKKPDIMGPGTHISGAAPQNVANPGRTGNGTVLACFNASGVCAGPGGSDFFPLSQQWYTASSGTSHSCPAVAGTAALYRQWFTDHSLTPPSPALTKALLMNGARYMTGVGANDTLPSNNQGMGEANLNNFFDIFATAHIFHDQTAGDLFTATGQQRTIAGTVSSNTKPFRAVLAWTEPPGSTTGNSFINNLDLEVTVGGNTYKGNVFTGAVSSTGGVADIRNNTESVFVPAGVSGSYVIKVTATNIAGDGVPGNGSPLDQDFALVVYNATETAAPVVAAGTQSITAESCNPPNNKVDPGETVTVNFGLSNVGTSNTSNLVATLQATGGVTSPSGPQNYGALVAGGAEVVRPFTFTSGGSCGTPVVATFQLQDGATNLGSVTFTFQNGTTIVTFTENFDSVSAPALPAGWVASNAVNPDGILWITSTSTPDTAPNALFINDPSVVSDKRIDTPGIFISSPIAQVSFRNNYALEPIGGGANFFDGAVLEVSSPNIAGGAFTDITAAAVGGSFASGGYNGTISTSFSNPIGGRQAWSQSSGGYINSVANLGPNVAGQTIKLRFRMCSDSSVTGTGWRVDTIQVSGGSACCGVATPTPGPTGTPTPTPGPGTPTPTPPPGTPTPTPCAGGVQLSQAFDDITSLVPGGWFMQNNSQPGPGTTGWFQGNSDVFPAQSGAATSYIGTNFNNGTGTSTLSNWLLTPPVTLQNGTVLTFWTRTVPTPAFPDRLQVRMSTNGASVNVGTTATDVGDFTTVLLDINPTYTTSGYPNVWTQFNVVVSGVASPTSGRLAMRYFVENGGPSGVNSDYIGIDTLQITGSGGCTPTPTPGGGTATPTPTPTPPGGTPTPTPCGSLNENFDGVTAPALPAGWVASNAVNPDGVLWITSTTTPDSAPNAAFINDPSVVSDKRLDSPGIAITQAGAQVSFRNNYALEPIAGGANFFDGAVLEVSSPNIAGGAFTDITAAAVGGSFVSGGYNGTISTSFSNPIGGRMAWSQSSGGYINTVANLGPNVIGQTIKIRFRMCSDSSVTGTGWRIDNVSVTGGSCGPTPTPCAGCTPTPSPTATPPGTPTPTPGCTPLAQGFDDITTLVPAGWFMQNNSQPGPGTTNWFQGNSDVFPAQGGGATSYIGTNFNNGTGTSTLSNWLLTPPVSLQNGVVLTFWTRTVDAPAFPDRLQVRMSTNGASTNVGTTATSVGDFTTMLLDINPTYTVDGYPNVWTQFTVTLSGIASPTTGRLAMRYFVENGGPSGVNSDFIGIDTLSISGGCGTPAPTPTPTPVSPTPVPTTPPPFTPTPTPGVTPTVTPTPGVTPTPTATPSGITHAQNLSTRLRVETGNNVGIGGFIITGTDPKEVLIRGIGPSLAQFGIPNPLADPKLELNGSGGFITVTNNNWRDNQEQQIIDTGIPPTNDLESAILATLDPGSYTAVLSGNDGGSGAALVEIYDLSPNANSKLANISTRAFVNTGSDVVIGGFILGGGSVSDQIIVRGIGPSLAGAGLSPVLADPRLELRDSDGTLVRSNNDWQDDPSQAAIISGVNLAPTDALESALAETLSPGAYTAVLFGANNGTGLGLVEVYDNPQPGGTPAPTATPCSSCSPTPTPVPTTPPPPTPTETPSPTPGGGGTCTEAFDQVTAPGLPAGWVASNPDPGDGSMFTTVTAPNDTAPNAAFVPDQDNISDKVLDSRPINIQTANSVMTFRNNFNTEFSDGVFWDGGVLEVSTPSISSGDFLDITDSHIGGSITAGGYTGEISGDASNPLSGRMAWSSNSNGWITTTINMGPNLAGQTVTLRFRFGTDEATAAPGWWFDTISISDATCP